MHRNSRDAKILSGSFLLDLDPRETNTLLPYFGLESFSLGSTMLEFGTLDPAQFGNLVPIPVYFLIFLFLSLHFLYLFSAAHAQMS